MPEAKNAHILEIIQQAGTLSMSISEADKLSSTIKHCSQIPISRQQVIQVCQEITSTLNSANKKRHSDPGLSEALEKSGQFLWDHLLTGPVKTKLKSFPSGELILFIDEELIGIPWELLHDGSTFLCLKFNLGRQVRTRQLEKPLQYRSCPSTLRMLILANPTGDLKSAYLEGTQIRNQFDRLRSQVKIDFKSTDIDTLYVKKNLRDYDIVHFAGHCEYEASANKAGGWLLSDGRLTAQDIISLGESESLSLPGLIFSNACSSAKAAVDLLDTDYQEKTYSLAAAFLFSGVRHYIGTIWQVEDPVSLEFAREFYSHLTKGKSIGEAIRGGRIQLIKEYGVFGLSWANYILYGDPAHCLFGAKPAPALPGKIKKAVKKQKRNILKVFLTAIIVGLVVYVFSILPFKNPAAYLLYIKAGKLFNNGKNQDTITLSRMIIKTDPMFLAVYPLLADTYQRMGDKDNALKSYFDYAIHSQKKNDKKNLAAAYTGIGWLYHRYGEYPKAFAFYNKAIQASRENKDALNEAVGLRKLAVWYIDKEDYDKALELLTKSSEINRSNSIDHRYRYNLACDYFDIGLVFADKDDYATAAEFYKKSRLLFERMKLKAELSDYYFNLGELSLFEKQYGKALECYQKGLKIDEMQGNTPSIAADYSMFGELYMEMGNFADAEKYFLKSIALSQQIKAFPELAAGYYNMGLLNKSRNRRRDAKEYFRLAQEIYRNIETPAYQRIREEFGDLE